MKKELGKKEKISISIMIGVVAILLVSTLFIQIRSVEEYKKAGIETLRDDELETQIATYKAKYEEAEEQYQENQNIIQEYKNTANENEKTSELLDKELEQTNMLLGLTDVTGPGVVITMKNTMEIDYTASNIRNLINELKYAGAEAISINGNRVINLTDIVEINDSYILMYGNVRLNSPYVVKAIGDTTYLTSTLNMKNTGFVDTMKSYGLDIKVEEENKITIEKYKGNLENKYMKGEE